MNRDLQSVAEELCAVFAEERRAIAKLDHTRLTDLVAHKQALAEELATLARIAGTPDVRATLDRIRIEASATAMLATTAQSAVKAALGHETAGYDRRARLTTQQLPHIHVAL